MVQETRDNQISYCPDQGIEIEPIQIDEMDTLVIPVPPNASNPILREGDAGKKGSLADPQHLIGIEQMGVTSSHKGDTRKKGGQWKKKKAWTKGISQEIEGGLLVHSGEKHSFETMVEDWGPVQVRKKICTEKEDTEYNGELGSAEVASQPRRAQWIS